MHDFLAQVLLFDDLERYIAVGLSREIETLNRRVLHYAARRKLGCSPTPRNCPIIRPKLSKDSRLSLILRPFF